jgi:hypothetical protein
VCRTRLLSTREWRTSRSAPATSSAASSEHPRLNTASRRKSACSSGESRSWLHSIVARSVCWRASAFAAALEQVEPVGQALEQLPGREHPGAGGGELEREREVVEAAADLGDDAVRLEIRVQGACAGREELDSFCRGQGWYRVLPLRGEVERLSACHEHVEPWAGAQHLAQAGAGLDHLLEVVQQDQHAPVADVGGELLLGAKRPRRRRQHELGITQRRQRHPPDTVGVGIRGDARGLEG